MCILCKSVVRSEDVWKVHINAKQHKQNIEFAKKLKQDTNNFTAPKRPATPPSIVHSIPPSKKIKGILKNSSTIVSNKTTDNSKPTNAIPSDFFDNNKKSGSIENANYFEATLHKTSIRKDLLNIRRDKARPLEQSTDELNGNCKMDVDEKDEILPEGFFDDPVKDAKARNLEYKDPVEEEWERFQKEIKVAADCSNAIIAEDQEEATVERQIDEIDEQIRNWSRFVFNIPIFISFN